MVFTYQTLQGVGTLAVQGLQTADNSSPFKWTPSNAAEVTAVVNLMARGINATNRMLSINFNNAGRGETRAPEPESSVDSKVVEAGVSGAGDPDGSGRFELMDDMFGPTIEARAGTTGDNWVTGSNTANGGDGAKVDGKYGDLFLKADASWTYRLDNERDLTDALATGVTMDDNFQFRAFDGGKYSEIALVGIMVTGDNDAPVAVDSPSVEAATAGATYTADLNALFTDAESDALTYTLGTGTCAGFAVSDTNLIGSDSGTVPADTAVGMVACAVTADDTKGGTASTTLQVTVNAAAVLAPMAVADSATDTEDAGTITGNVLDGASGGEDVGTGLTVTRYVAGSDITASPANAPDAAQGAHGSLSIVAASGAFTYTLADSNNALAADVINTDAFIYEISGSNGALSTATLTITITGVNDAPKAVDSPSVEAATAGATYTADLNALFTDAEDDTLTYAPVGTCDGFVVSGTNLIGSDNGTVPATTTAGTKDCSVTADDNNGGTTTVAFQVTVALRAGSLTIELSRKATETFSVSAKISGSQQGQTGVVGNNRWSTTTWAGPTLPAGLFPDGTSQTDRTVVRLSLRETGEVELRLGTGDGSARGPAISDPQNVRMVITYYTSSGQGSLAIQGIGTGSTPDTSEPYLWTPTNSAEVSTAMMVLGSGSISDSNRVVSVEFNNTGSGTTSVPANNVFDFTVEVPLADQQYGGNGRWRTEESWSQVVFPAPWFSGGVAKSRTLARVLSRPSGEVELRFDEFTTAQTSLRFTVASQIRIVFTYQTPAGVGTVAVQGIEVGDNIHDPYKWTPSNSAEVAAMVNELMPSVSATNRMLSINFNNAGRGATSAPTPPPPPLDTSVTEAGVDMQGQAVAGDENAHGRFDIMDGMSSTSATVEGRVGSGVWTAGSDTATSGAGARIEGTYGDLFLKADASWTYRLINDRDATNALAADASVMDTFTFRAYDGTIYSPNVTLDIDVVGTNDVPSVTNPGAQPAVREAGVDSSGDPVTAVLTVSGTFSITDPDMDDTHTYEVSRADAYAVVLTSQVLAGSYGSLTVADTGGWSYTLSSEDAINSFTADRNETETFNIRVRDASTSVSEVYAFTIAVQGTNDAPVAVDNPSVATAIAGLPYTEDLTALFTDAESDTLMFALVGACDGFIVSGTDLVGSGSDTTAPAAGMKQCEIRASDGKGGTGSVTLQITVRVPGEPPVAADDAVTDTEDAGMITGNVLDGTSGGLDTGMGLTVTRYASGDDIDVSPANAPAAVDGEHGSLVIVATSGAFTYTVDDANHALRANRSNTDDFVYEITNGDGVKDTARLRITITGANDAPTFVNAIPTRSVFRGAAFSYPIPSNTFTDPDEGDQDRLTYTAMQLQSGVESALPTWLSFSSAGTFSSADVPSTASSLMIVVRARDGNGGVTAATAFTLTILMGTNTAPEANNSEGVTDEDTALFVVAAPGVLSNDTDDDDNPLSVTRYAWGFSIGNTQPNVGQQVNGGFGTLTMAADGSYTYAPDSSNNALADGEDDWDNFTYEISDGNLTDTARLRIVINGVNDPPKAVDSPSVEAATAGATYTADLNALFTDAESDKLTYTLMMGTCDGFVVSGTNLIGSDGGTVPAATTAETKDCSVTADDNKGGTTTVAFQVTVNAAVPAPVAVADTVTDTEDAGTITGDVIAGGEANAGKDSGTGLSVTRYAAGPSLSGSLATPAPNPVSGSHGTLTIATSGAFTYTVADSNHALQVGESNPDEFIYEISDSTGALATATLTISITGANDQPSVTNPGAQPTVREAGVDVNGDPVAAKTTTSGTFSITDPDAGDTHTYQVNDADVVVSHLANGRYGSLAVAADGGWTYTLRSEAAINSFNTGRRYNENFGIRVRDARGSRSAKYILTVAVRGTNDAPVALANPSVATATATAGEPYTVSLNNLFSDAETDILNYTLGTCDGFAVSGTDLVGRDGGTVPATTTAGTKQCEITASDGKGGTGSVILQITVNAPDGPVAADDAETDTEDAGMITGNVLDGTSGGQDAGMGLTVTRYASGDDIDVSPANAPASADGEHGSLVIVAASGAFTYTVDDANNALRADRSNTDDFVYEITDGDGAKDTARLRITITGANDAPTFVNAIPPRSVFRGAAFSYPVPSNTFTDPDEGDQDRLTYTAMQLQSGVESALPTWLSFPSTGTFSSADVPSTASSLMIVVRARDRNDAVAAATAFTLTILTGTNTAPVANNSEGVTDEDTALFVVAAPGVLSNDTDDDDNPLSVTRYVWSSSIGNTQPNVGQQIDGNFGTLTMAADGSYTYAPDSSNNALADGDDEWDNFTYEISDGNLTDTARLRIIIKGVNDLPNPLRAAVAMTDEDTVLDSGTSVTQTLIRGRGDPDDLDFASVVSYAQGATLPNTGLTRVTQPAQGLYGSVVIFAGGRYVYTPGAAAQALHANAQVMEVFSFRVEDLLGAGRESTLTITITGRNDGPEVVDNPSIPLATVNVQYRIDMNTLFSDADASTDLAFTLGTCSTAIFARDGDFLIGAGAGGIIPVGTAAGDNSCEITASDGTAMTTHTFQVETSTMLATPSATLDLTLPEAAATYQSEAGQRLVYGGSFAGVAAGTSYSQAAASAAGVAEQGTHGALTMAADGSFSYQANVLTNALSAGQVRTDVFTYLVRQGSAEGEGTLTFHVHGLNDQPTLTADSNADVEVTTSNDSAAMGGFSYADADSADIGFDNDGDGIDEGGVLEGTAGAVTSSSVWTPGVGTGKGASIEGVYGTLFLKADSGTTATWSYELDTTDPETLALAAGSTATDRFAVRIDDVTVTGTQLQRGGTTVRTLSASESDTDTQYSALEEIAISVTSPPSVIITPPAERGLVASGFVGRSEQARLFIANSNYWYTTTWDGLELPAQWFPAGTSTQDRTVVHVGLRQNGEVEVALGTTDLGSAGAGAEFLMPASIRMVVTYETTTGQGTLAVDGIGTSGTRDATEPYQWTPSNSAEVAAAAMALRSQSSTTGPRVLKIEFNDTRRGTTTVPTAGTYDLTALIPLSAQTYSGDNPRWRTETWTGPAMPAAWATATGDDAQTLQRVLLRPNGSIELRFGHVTPTSSPITFLNPSTIRVVFTYQTPNGIGTLAIQGLVTTGNSSPFMWTPSNSAEVTAMLSLLSAGLSENNRMLSINFNNAGRGVTSAPKRPAGEQDTEVTETGVDMQGAVVAGDEDAGGSFSIMDDMPGATTIEGRAGTTGSNWTTGISTGDGAKVDGAYGELFLMADATWTYRLLNARDATNALAAGATAPDTFTFRAYDGRLYSSIVRLDIGVTGTNDAPVAVDSPSVEAATAGETYTADLNALFTDAESDTLTYTLGAGTCGGFAVSGTDLTGRDSGTVPAATTAGTKACEVTADDNKGGMTPITFSVSVRAAVANEVSAIDDVAKGTEDVATISGNVILGDPIRGNAGADTGTGLRVTRYAAGPQGSTMRLTSAPNSVSGLHGTLTIEMSGVFTYTVADSNNSLAVGDSNMDTFVYEVSNGAQRDTAELTITVTGVNDAPVAGVIPDRGASENVGFGYTVPVNTFTDPEDDTLVYSADLADGNMLPTWLDFDAAAQRFSGTPPSGSAGMSLSIRVTATDPGGETDTSTFTLSITTDLAGSDDYFVTNEDAAGGSGSLNGGRTTDVLGRRIAVSRYARGTDITVRPVTLTRRARYRNSLYGSIRVFTSGTWQYQVGDSNESLAVGSRNIEIFTYEISTTDRMHTGTGTLTIAIEGRNDVPVANPDIGAVTVGGRPLTVTADYGLLSNDTDVDDGAMLTVVGYAQGSSYPASGATTAGNVAQGIYGTLNVAADGSYTYTAGGTAALALAGGTMATETFAYRIQDEHNATRDSTLTITVTGGDTGPENIRPVAVDDRVVTDEDAGMVTGNVLQGMAGNIGADSDPDGDPLEVTHYHEGTVYDAAVAVAVSNAGGITLATERGVLVMEAGGDWTFTIGSAHQSLVTGSNSVNFVYRISDSALTNEAMLTIVIEGRSDVPVLEEAANPDHETIERGIDMSGNAVGDNRASGRLVVRDPDAGQTHNYRGRRMGSTIEILGRDALGDPAGEITGVYGSLFLGSTGHWNYLLNSNEAAINSLAVNSSVEDVFEFQANDGADFSKNLTITITVAGSNDAPTFANTIPPQTAIKGRSFSYQILADTFTDPDDGASLTYSAVLEGVGSLPDWLGISAGGLLSSAGIPVDAPDSLSIVVKANDGLGGEAESQAFTLTTAVPAMAVDDVAEGNEEDPTISGDVIAGDVNAGNAGKDSGTGLTVTRYAFGTDIGTTPVAADASENGNHGSLVITAQGAFTYTVADSNNPLDASGRNMDEFIYEIEDSGGTKATAMLTITITGFDDAPVVTNNYVDRQTTEPGVGDAGDLDANGKITATDVDTPAASVTIRGRASRVPPLAWQDGADDQNDMPATVLEGTYGSLTLGRDGTWVYRLDPARANPLNVNDTAADTFEFSATDGTSDSLGIFASAFVKGKNDAPMQVSPVPDIDAASAGEPYTLDLNRFFTDPDDAADLMFMLMGTCDGFGISGDNLVGSESGSVPSDTTPGAKTCSISVRDGFGGTVTGAISITVEVPVMAVDDEAEGTEDETMISGDVIEGDASDVGADSGTGLSVTRYAFGSSIDTTPVAADASENGNHGSLVITAKGVFTYTVASSNHSLAASGRNMDEFIYEIEDDGGTKATAKLTITITGVNDLPTLAEEIGQTGPAPDKETQEAGGSNNDIPGDTMGKGKLNASDVDDGAVVTIQGRRAQPQGQWLSGTDSGGAPATVIDGRLGELTLGADGTWIYALDDDRAATNALQTLQTVTDAFDFRASDGTGFSTPLVQVEISVNGNNDRPTFANVIPAQTAIKGQPFSYQIPANTFADPDTATLTYKAKRADDSPLPTWLRISASGLLSSTSVPDSAPASLSIVVSASDGGFLEASAIAFTLTIREPAVMAVDDKAEGTENVATITGDVIAGSATNNPTGADSGTGLSVTRYAFGSSIDTTPVAADASENGNHGSLVITAKGAFTYTVADSNHSLAAGASNTDEFTYEIEGSGGTKATAKLTITITGVNDLPTLAEETGQTGPAPDKETQEAGGSNNDIPGETMGKGKLNASDVDDGAVVTIQGRRAQPQGQWLTGTDSGGVPATVIDGRLGELTLGADGTWTYVLDDDRAATNALQIRQTVTDAFDFRASDGTGFSTPLVQVEISVNGNNDTPTFANVIPAQKATRGQPFRYQIPANTFADPDTANLTYKAKRADDSPLPTWLGISASGLLSSSSVPDSAPASLSIVVSASDGGFLEASAIAFTLTIEDATSAVSAANDTLKIVEDRTGFVTFNVIAGTGFGTSGTGGVDSGEGVVVTRYWVGRNTAGTVIPVNTLVNTLLGRLQIAADGAGRFNLAEGNPAVNGLDDGEMIDAVFTYEIRDANGVTDTATLTITITGVDDPPVAQGDRGTVSEDGPALMVAAPGVLANDTDPEGDSVTFTVTRYAIGTTLQGSGTMAGTALPTPNFGTLTLNANGSYTFEPDEEDNNFLRAGRTRVGSYTYEVSDGAAEPLLLTARLTITVVGANDAPTIFRLIRAAIVIEAGVDAQGAPVRGMPSQSRVASSSDPDEGDNHRLQVRFDGGPWVNQISSGNIVQSLYGALDLNGSHWVYMLDNDRAATNALAAGAIGQDVFEFRAWDGTAASATQMVTITVNGTNDAPVVMPDIGMVSEGTTLRVDEANGLLANDSDPDTGATITVVGYTTGSSYTGSATMPGDDLAGMHGTLNVAADGSYTYTPGAMVLPGVSPDEFSYRVEDGAGGGAESTLTIRVRGANAVPTLAVVNGDTDVTEEGAAGTGDPGASGTITAADANTGQTVTVEGSAGASGTNWIAGPVPGIYGDLTLTTTSWTYTLADDRMVTNALADGVTVEDAFRVRASDGSDQSAPETITIQVAGSNDAPVAMPDVGMANEGTTLTVDAANGLLDNDMDPDAGATLSVIGYTTGSSYTAGSATMPGNNLPGAYGTLNVAANGGYSYTPGGTAPVGTTPDVFSYRVEDKNNVGAESTLTIRVTRGNVAPTVTLANTDTAVTEEGAAGTGNPGASGTITAVDANTEQTPTVEGSAGAAGTNWIAGPVPGIYGDLTLTTTSWTYALDDDRAATNALDGGDTAQDTFRVRASDGMDQSAPETIMIQVTGSNDAPTANPDPNPTVVVVGGPGLNVTAADGVLTNDTDPDADDIPSTFAVVGYRSTVDMTSTVGLAVMGHYGSVIMMADGSYTYTTGGGTAANLLSSTTVNEFFTYRMQDGDGATADGTLRIRVRGSSTQPTLTVDNTDPDVKESGVTPTGGVENGTASATGTVTAVGGIVQGVVGAGTVWRTATTGGVTLTGTYGDLSLRLDGWTYTLANDRMATNALAVNASAQDIFRVRATNAIGTANPVTVTVAVAGTNDAPVAGAAIPARTVARGGAFPAFSVPTNVFTDPEDDPLTYTAALEGGGGLPTWLVLSTGGEFTSNGSVPSNAPSSLSIVVTAADDKNGQTAAAAFTLTIAVNSGPVEVNAIADVTIDEDAAWAFTFPAAGETNNVFSDPDGHALTYSSMQVVNGTQQALPAWLVQGSTGRTFRGTPRDADVGTITIRVTATDTGWVDGHHGLRCDSAQRQRCADGGQHDRGCDDRRGRGVGLHVPGHGPTEQCVHGSGWRHADLLVDAGGQRHAAGAAGVAGPGQDGPDLQGHTTQRGCRGHHHPGDGERPGRAHGRHRLRCDGAQHERCADGGGDPHGQHSAGARRGPDGRPERERHTCCGRCGHDGADPDGGRRRRPARCRFDLGASDHRRRGDQRPLRPPDAAAGPLELHVGSRPRERAGSRPRGE